MNKISANKLTRMSAVQLYMMLNTPAKVKKKTAFQPEVLKEPKDTPKNLAMSASTLVGDVRVYFSFDEIYESSHYVTLVDRRQFRNNSPESHLQKCLTHVAVLATLVETSGKILTTVKCLTNQGYNYHRVDLRDKRLEYVLDLNTKVYGIDVFDRDEILSWVKLKLASIQDFDLALIFDRDNGYETLSSYYGSWET